MSSAITAAHLAASADSMTEIADSPQLVFPHRPNSILLGPSLTGVSLLDISGTGGDVSMVLAAPKAGDIDKIFFRTGTVGTGCTVNAGVAGVTTGTANFSDFNSATQVIGDTDDNTGFLVDLGGSARTVTKGELIAIGINYASGSAPTIQIAYLADDRPAAFSNSSIPNPFEDTTSRANAYSPCWALGYSDGTWPWIPHCWPMTGTTTSSYDSADNPNVHGAKIVPPYTCRLAGGWFWADIDGTAEFNLYDHNGSESATATIGAADENYTGASCQYRYFDGPILLKNHTYWVGLEATSVTNIAFYQMDFQNAAMLSFFGQGFMISGASAQNPTDDGDWTLDDDRLPFMGLILDGIEAGGAGFSSHIVIG